MPMTNEDLQHFPLMSKNNNNSISSLMEARKFYYTNTLPYIQNKLSPENSDIIQKIPFSDIYGKNFFYGILDKDNDVICPINNNKNFDIVAISKDYTQLKLQNFVSKAFKDMKQYLNLQVLQRVIDKNSYFYNISVSKAYSNFDDVSKSTCLIIAEKFKEYLLKNKQINSKIKSFSDFNREFLNYTLLHLEISPITKSSLAFFYNYRILYSGLSFFISNEDPGDDEKKFTNFFTDINFGCFMDACVRFGFKIDKNVPYLLHADLNSPAMQIYMQNSNIINVETLHKERYKKVYLEDIEYLKRTFYNAYVIMTRGVMFKESTANLCTADAIRLKSFKRYEPTYEQYISSFSEMYWVSLYIYIKNYETKKNLSQIEYENLLKKTSNLLKSKSGNEVLKYLNLFFNNITQIKIIDPSQKFYSVLLDEQPPRPETSGAKQLFFRG